MNATERALKWKASLESESDGVAREVDVTNVKVEVDIDDVDKNDIHDVEDTETENVVDGGELVGVKEGDISKEDFDTVTSSADGAGKTIDVTFTDEATNLPRRFVISGFDCTGNAAKEDGDNPTQCVILLQNGTIPENGLNGVTAEDLMKVCEEVFTCYQESQFACEENEEALGHIRSALAAMAKRTNRRIEDGVEGTHVGN